MSNMTTNSSSSDSNIQLNKTGEKMNGDDPPIMKTSLSSWAKFFDPSWTVKYVDCETMELKPYTFPAPNTSEEIPQFTASSSSTTPSVKNKKSTGLKKIKRERFKNRVKKSNESSIANITSSAILAATTKDFENLKRSRLNFSKNVPEPIIDDKSLEHFQQLSAEFQSNRKSLEEQDRESNYPKGAPSSSKNNQIWGNVINQQLVSEVSVGVVSLGVENSYGVGNRGPENYITRLMRKRKREYEDSENGKCMAVEVESDLSSDGLSDDSKEYWRQKKKNQRNMATVGKETSIGSEAVSGDLKQSSSFASTTSPIMDTAAAVVSQNVSTPDFKESHSTSTLLSCSPKIEEKNPKPQKSFLWEKMEGMEHEQLGHYLATKLREKNRELIVRAVTLLGKEQCVKFYFKVLKIECGGGLLIKSKERRRTKGGVFLYLIRNDKRLSQEKVELLFNEDKTRRIEFMRTESEENQRKLLLKQGMDDFQIRMHKRMTAESVGMKEKREIDENNVVCNIDEDEDFSFSVDKLVHHQPGYVPHEGPVGNRNAVVYDDVELMEEDLMDIYDEQG